MVGVTFFGTRDKPIRPPSLTSVLDNVACSPTSIVSPLASRLSKASARTAAAANLLTNCNFASDNRSAPPMSETIPEAMSLYLRATADLPSEFGSNEFPLLVFERAVGFRGRSALLLVFFAAAFGGLSARIPICLG